MKETNLTLAQKVKLKPIKQIAEKLGLSEESYESYGFYKAKLPLDLIDESKVAKNKLILVTAMTPTKTGEGKTTISVGLSEALNRCGHSTMVALREPSLGPVFGTKGGATGGGNAQVLPMEDINLHFTGDFAAIEKANNLIASLVDNFILNSESPDFSYPRIDPKTVVWKRVIDSNDRFLRKVITGLGGATGGIPCETGFNITAASEIMAILCLSTSIADLKRRIGQIYVGDTYEGRPVYVKDFEIQGAVALLLKEAIKPNLVQTTEGNAALIHGGPFANIAQGTSSILATKMAMSLADFTVTEAGFGADLGAEKFVNIKCQTGGFVPSAVVVVATVKALRAHGNEDEERPMDAIKSGFSNLKRHLNNVAQFGRPYVVAVNRFPDDSEEELALVKSLCSEEGVSAFSCDVWQEGGAGALELAEFVAEHAQTGGELKPTYDWKSCTKEKIEAVAKEVYGARQVQFQIPAQKKLRKISAMEIDNLPICIAKTPMSFSDNALLKGAPGNFDIVIRDIEIASGAGFVVPLAGNILRMPGLPAKPAALNMDISDDGQISGLN